MEFSFHNAVCFPYTTTLRTGILKWLYIIFNGAKTGTRGSWYFFSSTFKNPEVEIRDGTFSGTQREEIKGSL